MTSRWGRSTPLYGLYAGAVIRGYAAGQGMVFGLFVLNRVYNFYVSVLNSVYFVICPKQGVILHRVGILGLFLF